MSCSIPFITEELVRKLLPINEAISLMQTAFIQISNSTVTIPQRINVDMPEVNADSLVMPVYSADEKKFGVKIVSLNQDNPLNNLPFIHALMVLFDAKTGKPLAILNAENLTAIRTGAASGLATKLFSDMNSSVAAIFGAGIQAKYQLRSILEAREIKKVYLFDKNEDKAKSFKDELSSEYDIDIHITNDQNKLKEAQIISTATTSSEPVFDDKYISDDMHINAIGSYQPNKREIPAETVKRAKIFVDSKEACLKEAGDLIIPLSQGNKFSVNEIGEIFENEKLAADSQEHLTIFKSVGNAAQDLICAIHIFNKYSK
jgi:ornithine cyclodeaminase/alanine dehydrogenase-like protein (mu-crystallin family)